MPNFPTETELSARLWYQKVDASYLAFLCDLHSDPDVMHFINGGTSSPIETMRVQLLEWLNTQQKWEPRLGCFVVHSRENGVALGWVTLKPDRFFPGEVEIGYRFHKRFWGQGVATEAAGTMIARARRLKIERVIAHTLERNVRSQNVMSKLGMTLEEQFVYPQWVCEQWDETERRGVKYSLLM